MAYRKFKARQLFDGYQILPAGHVLVTQSDGTITDIIPGDDAGGQVELLEGILSPGLINAHCHLELSHMKNLVPPNTGLVDFLCAVIQRRADDIDQVQEAMTHAQAEMYKNGIVAVGDISNSISSIPVKQNSRLWWHNFIEVLSLSDERTAENMQRFENIFAAFQSALPAPSRAVLTPHAPYSISPRAFQLLNAATSHQIISIHNQESAAEDELYKSGSGDFLRLFSLFGINQSPLPVTGLSSIRSYLPYFGKAQTLLLVHNTYMPPEDMAYANAYAQQAGLQIFYCLCPNANLYIEGRMPPVDDLIRNNCMLLLGTDSYSSNWQLSIVAEMRILQLNFPRLTLETMLRWATSNAALAFGWNDQLGSFETGKKPGIVLLNEDLSKVERIL